MASSLFRISTYNTLVESWARNNKPALNGMSWETRRDNLVQRMRDINADIYCLQEVDRFDSLAEKMGQIGYYGVHAARNNGEKEGCAVFYKKDKISILKENGNEQTVYYFNDGTGRMIQRVVFNILQKTVEILNSHLIFELARTGQTTKTQKELELFVARAQKVASETLRPTIVCADLNITADKQEALNRFKVNGFADALAASPNANKPTHIHDDQPMRIDYIFSKNITATANCDVWGDPAHLKDPLEPSDHLPIVSEFDLNSVSKHEDVATKLQILETEFAQDNPAAIDHFQTLPIDLQNKIFGNFYPLIKPGLSRDYLEIAKQMFLSAQNSQDLNLSKLFDLVKLPPGKDLNLYKSYIVALKRFEIVWNTESDAEKIKQTFYSLPEWVQRDIRLGLWKKTQIEGGEYFNNNPKSGLVLEVIEELKSQGRYRRN